MPRQCQKLQHQFRFSSLDEVLGGTVLHRSKATLTNDAPRVVQGPQMDTTHLIFFAVEGFIGIVSVTSNIVVVLAIMRNPQLHTATNLHIANLALADIGVGLFVVPLTLLSLGTLPLDFYGCLIVYTFTMQLTNVSVLMLVTVAVERFFAIKEPLLHNRVMTPKRAMYVNIVVWMIGFFLGLVPMYWNPGYKEINSCTFTAVVAFEYIVYFQFFAFMLVPLLLMTCIYMYIVLIVRRHMRTDSSLFQHIRSNENNRFSSYRDNTVTRLTDTKEEQRFNKDVRAAKMFGVIIIVFTICWLPINIYNTIVLFCDSNCKVPYESLLVALTLSHLNSSVNPFLYALSNVHINNAIRKLLGVKVKRAEPSIATTPSKKTTTRDTSSHRSRRPFGTTDTSPSWAEHSVDPPMFCGGGWLDTETRRSHQSQTMSSWV